MARCSFGSTLRRSTAQPMPSSSHCWPKPSTFPGATSRLPAARRRSANALESSVSPLIVQPADFLIEHAALVATCAGPAPRRGRAQADISPLTGATVAAHQGVIVYVGPAGGLDAAVHVLPDATRVDAGGCTVVPGFVDPHTHIVY